MERYCGKGVSVRAKRGEERVTSYYLLDNMVGVSEACSVIPLRFLATWMINRRTSITYQRPNEGNGNKEVIRS